MVEIIHIIYWHTREIEPVGWDLQLQLFKIAKNFIEFLRPECLSRSKNFGVYMYTVPILRNPSGCSREWHSLMTKRGGVHRYEVNQ